MPLPIVGLGAVGLVALLALKTVAIYKLVCKPERCQHCSTRVSSQTKDCPKCGNPIQTKATTKHQSTP